MFWWDIPALCRASSRNRSANVGSSAVLARMTLTATSRPSTESVARQTSPMPPAAMRSVRVYRLPRVIPASGFMR